MSIITDALEKVKKEAGEEQAQRIAPVSLDEPQVEVPEEKHTRRTLLSVVVVLLIAGGAVSAFFLARDLFGRRSSSDRSGGTAQVASLPQGEGPEVSPPRETEEPLPLPGTTPLEEPSPSAGPPEAPGTAPSPQPSPAEGPSLQKPEPSAPETIPPTTSPAATSGPQETTPTAPSGPTPEGATPSPKPDSVAPEPTAPPPPDPFAGIKLQGIMRFDPNALEVLINGKTLKVGDSIGGITVVKIEEDSVTLRSGTNEKTITY